MSKISDFLFLLRHLEGKRLFVFGAGPLGREVANELKLLSGSKVDFIDNDATKWGKSINGSEVYSPNHILTFSEDELFIFIVSRYRDDISIQLTNMGFEEYKHYIAERFYKSNEMNLSSFFKKSKQPAVIGRGSDLVMKGLFDTASKKSDEYELHNKQALRLEDDDPKIIAFYLPQFHPFKENDKWWGKGFTEWTNVSKAIPQFVGHYQPHLPDELGFYDLRLNSVQERQVELAKHYGVYGFCFHYYNFAGKRLLEGPLNSFVENEEIDFPFCICWANEPWSRRWDGSEHLVLMEQKHSLENDTNVIRDMLPLFKDKNYIKVKNKPLLIVYRVGLLPELQKTIENWESILKEEGFDGIYLVAAQTYGFSNPTEINFDAAVEFPPHKMTTLTDITNNLRLVNQDFVGNVNDYQSYVKKKEYLEETDYRVFKTAFPNWDNTARKPNNGFILHGSTPKLYQEWLEDIIRFSNTKKTSNEDNFVFINAWNEWAEGAHLEPDRKYGYAYLRATTNALKNSRT